MSSSEPAPERPKVEIVSGPELAKLVPLAWSYRYEGRMITTLGVRHLRVSEVAAFMSEAARLKEIDPNRRIRLPIYTDEVGAPIADELIDGLLDDDLARLEEAAASFIPARFRDIPASPSASQTGGTAEP